MGLSVIIPCYNAEKTIIRAIQSVINQRDVEVIVIDDCSTDNSWFVLQRYQKNCADNLKIFKNENNIGAGKTRNRGIKLATKEYITFLDSDDEVSKDFENVLLENIEFKPDVIIYNAIIRQLNAKEKHLNMFYSYRRPKTGKLDKGFAAVFTKGCTCGKAYRLDFVLANAVEFSKLSINEDTVFTKRALLAARTIYYIDKELYIYNFQEESLMHTVNITVDQACQAYNEISQGYIQDDRLNSLFFLEVVYAGTKALILNSNDYHMIHEQFLRWKRLYKKDRYFWQYDYKYIVFYFMCSLKMYGLIKRIM